MQNGFLNGLWRIKMNIDLHCHTKMSDGSTGIGELIDLAKLRQIETLAVTDHDLSLIHI